MSPLEMNKKIAGIKRLNWVSSNTTNPALIDHDELPTSDRLHPPKNWAENIADAWELFEEMPWDLYLTRDRYGGSYSRGGWLCGYDLEDANSDDVDAMNFWSNVRKNDLFAFAADTAPLVICLAWLKWKGES